MEFFSYPQLMLLLFAHFSELGQLVFLLFPTVELNMCKTFDTLFHLVTLSVSHHASFHDEKCEDYLQKMLSYWGLPEQAKKLVL